jgi:hypothetical protein
MTLSNRDFRRLALPLAILLLLCGIAGALAWATERNARQALLERDLASESKQRSDMRLRQFRSDELDIKERSQLLQHLQASGILGEERRLDWTEQLGNTQRELRIPGMKYEFAPQTALPTNGNAGYAWFNSPLRLQLRLVHEVDLLNFLDRLQREAKALVIVRSCKLALPPALTNDQEASAALDADCELDWLTAHRPAGKR